MTLVVLLCAVSVPATAQVFGARPEPLTTPNQTEHAWAIRETTLDIAEMAASARGAKPMADVAPPVGAMPWTPEAFVAFAREHFGASKSPRTPVADQYLALAQLTSAAVARSSEIVSDALRRNMREPRAHDSAALVVAAFGLGEAAGGLSDVRWSLNRITAHLAVADALRPAGEAPSIDGQLARVAFLALANRTRSAMALLDAMAPRPNDRALLAWTRALRMRLTHDWRQMPSPELGSRIEKREYFRARRKTMKTVRAGQELAMLSESPAADFGRIVMTSSPGVEDGNDFVEPALGAELLEMSEVYRLVQKQQLPSAVPDAIINVRAGRLMSSGVPRVVSWGAWAEFFQRHIGLYIEEVDDFQRRMLASEDRADRTKAQLDQLFRGWTLFPVASIMRTRGRGLEGDATYLREAIAVAYRAPELVNYLYWSTLAFAVGYEIVPRGMPRQASWFSVAPSAAVPYEAGARARDTLPRLQPAALAALLDEASSDVGLHSHALAPRPNTQAVRSSVAAWFRDRAAFDLFSIDGAVLWSRTVEEDIEWRQKGCALAVAQCLSLARLYAFVGDEPKAVAEYERAFKNPALDAVAMANASNWLVRYYERTDQLPRAYDLAQRSADVGSGTGMTTLARLYERRGRIDEAEDLYRRIAIRYRRAAREIAGFYYRQFVVGGKPAYEARWRAIEQALFPNGLQKAPAAMTQQPAKGVSVYQDSATSRRVRLQAGDIIIAVDGWIVEDKEQFDAVMAFTEPSEPHKLTAWRGVLFTVTMPEDHGMDLQSYPLRGWMQ